MKTIEINVRELAKTIINNIHLAGSTEWDVYVNEDGIIDVRHNTHPNGDWYEVYDFYSSWSKSDLSESKQENIDWLISYVLNPWEIQNNINRNISSGDDVEIIFI